MKIDGRGGGENGFGDGYTYGNDAIISVSGGRGYGHVCGGYGHGGGYSYSYREHSEVDHEAQ